MCDCSCTITTQWITITKYTAYHYNYDYNHIKFAINCKITNYNNGAHPSHWGWSFCVSIDPDSGRDYQANISGDIKRGWASTMCPFHKDIWPVSVQTDIVWSHTHIHTHTHTHKCNWKKNSFAYVHRVKINLQDSLLQVSSVVPVYRTGESRIMWSKKNGCIHMYIQRNLCMNKHPYMQVVYSLTVFIIYCKWLHIRTNSQQVMNTTSLRGQSKTCLGHLWQFVKHGRATLLQVTSPNHMTSSFCGSITLRS